MPNWCENTVHFEHTDPKAITEVKEAFAEEKLCNYFLPIPDGTEDWHTNRIVKWGTKDVTMNVNLDDIVDTYSG